MRFHKQKPLLIKSIHDSYHWIINSGLEEEDIVVDQLPDPETIINKKKIISFCSNNYLGISKREEVIDAAKKSLGKYGIGTCESRRLGGDLRILEELENKIAKFKKTESSIIFATGSMANIGAIPALTDVNLYCNLFYGKQRDLDDVVVLSDSRNHRSIQMGLKLSHAKVYKYNHRDMNDLYRLLNLNKKNKILIITDGVFSMDGALAPLDQIVNISKDFNATIMIDDAHGTGVFGKYGRGSGEHFGIENDIHIKMGTLSKALGGLGGFVAADAEVVKMLKLSASTYYFTSSLPADSAVGLIESFNLIEREPELRIMLWHNIYTITKEIKMMGLIIPDRFSCIIPIIIGDEIKSLKAEKLLLEEGILCSSVRVPAVGRGEAQLRITVNSTHTAYHIKRLMNGLAKIAKELRIPLNPINSNDWKLFSEAYLPDYVKDFLKENLDSHRES